MLRMILFRLVIIVVMAITFMLITFGLMSWMDMGIRQHKGKSHSIRVQVPDRIMTCQNQDPISVSLEADWAGRCDDWFIPRTVKPRVSKTRVA